MSSVLSAARRTWICLWSGQSSCPTSVCRWPESAGRAVVVHAPHGATISSPVARVRRVRGLCARLPAGKAGCIPCLAAGEGGVRVEQHQKSAGPRWQLARQNVGGRGARGGDCRVLAVFFLCQPQQRRWHGGSVRCIPRKSWVSKVHLSQGCTNHPVLLASTSSTRGHEKAPRRELNRAH